MQRTVRRSKTQAVDGQLGRVPQRLRTLPIIPDRQSLASAGARRDREGPVWSAGPADGSGGGELMRSAWAAYQVGAALALGWAPSSPADGRINTRDGGGRRGGGSGRGS